MVKETYKSQVHDVKNKPPFWQLMPKACSSDARPLFRKRSPSKRGAVCFVQDVTDVVVTAIAKMQPMYAVLRDTSMKTDSTATNFEQIFKTYSPNTVTKIL